MVLLDKDSSNLTFGKLIAVCLPMLPAGQQWYSAEPRRVTDLQ